MNPPKRAYFIYALRFRTLARYAAHVTFALSFCTSRGAGRFAGSLKPFKIKGLRCANPLKLSGTPAEDRPHPKEICAWRKKSIDKPSPLWYNRRGPPMAKIF